MKNMVYAANRDAFEAALEHLWDDETSQQFPNFSQHILRTYLHRREAWATYIRTDLQLPTHSNMTNNYVESNFRIVKDFIFHRSKVLEKFFIKHQLYCSIFSVITLLRCWIYCFKKIPVSSKTS